MSVEEFKGEYYFLSNMYQLDNWVETDYGITVPTSEHAYQANRFVDKADHIAVATTKRGIDAKNLAHEMLAAGALENEDWGFIKPAVMYGIVTQKFVRNPDIAEQLLATGDQELWEGNSWNDRYWGVCPAGSKDGQNHMGRILMHVRHELRISSTATSEMTEELA